MSRRGRGRPAKTERDFWGQALWLERLIEEETATLRQTDLKPKKAQARAASRLEISERSARRLLAQARQATTLDWVEFGKLLRQLRHDWEKKNSGTDFLAGYSGSAE